MPAEWLLICSLRHSNVTSTQHAARSSQLAGPLHHAACILAAQGRGRSPPSSTLSETWLTAGGAKEVYLQQPAQPAVLVAGPVSFGGRGAPEGPPGQRGPLHGRLAQRVGVRGVCAVREADAQLPAQKAVQGDGAACTGCPSSGAQADGCVACFAVDMHMWNEPREASPLAGSVP